MSKSSEENFEQKEQEYVDTFTMIFDSIIKGEEQKYGRLISLFRNEYHNNESLYESRLSLFLANLNEFAAKPFLEDDVLEKDTKKRAIVPYLYNGVFAHFVRTYIENVEGRIYSGDKTRFVIKGVKKAIRTGTCLPLNQVYSEEDEWVKPENIGKRAYWSPKSFDTTDEVIEAFRNWYFGIGKE